MFSSIGLRLAARSIPSILSTARPTLSRTLFVSHFQTRSFVTTSPLAQAAAVTATRTARKISAKTKSSTTKKKKKPIAAKKPLVKKKKKIIKKTPAKKAPSVLHFSPCLFALSLKGCVVVVPRSMSMPPLRPVSGYVVFLREHIASLPKGYGTEVMRQRFKDTAGLWQALPEHAKEVGRILVATLVSFPSSHYYLVRQAYKERALALRGQWVENRLNWFKTIDPKILKEINRRKKLKGKSMMHKPKDPNAPWRAPGAFL
jgi:hypothetical protein